MIVQSLYSMISAGRSMMIEPSDGVEPYTFEVKALGAGGTIDVDGLYTAPSYIPDQPNKSYDTIIVTDADLTVVEHIVNLGTPIKFLGEIIRREMDLQPDQVTLYNQKFTIPKDEKVYISVGYLSQKPFSNNISYSGEGSGLMEIQNTNIRAVMTVEIQSRNTSALNRKEEILFAVNSTFAKQMMEANSFSIAKISSNFVNLSREEGSGIPYRFNISLVMHYTVTKTKNVSYFSNFQSNNVVIDR